MAETKEEFLTRVDEGISVALSSGGVNLTPYQRMIIGTAISVAVDALVGRYDPAETDVAPYTWPPYVPQPVAPMPASVQWDLTALKEYLDLLTRVKDLEDKLGCPCESNKADYLKMFEERIAALEVKVGKDGSRY